MKKKLLILSAICFVLSLGIFWFTFFLYHYVDVGGVISPVPLNAPGKPFVTLLFGVWGTCFLFASVTSFLASFIFGSKKDSK